MRKLKISLLAAMWVIGMSIAAAPQASAAVTSVSVNCRVNSHATAALHVNGVRHTYSGSYPAVQEKFSTTGVDWTAGPGAGYKADRVAVFLERGNGDQDLWFAFGGPADGNLNVAAQIRNIQEPEAGRVVYFGIPDWKRLVMRVYTASGTCEASSSIPLPT